MDIYLNKIKTGYTNIGLENTFQLHLASINDLDNGIQAMYLSVNLYCVSNNPAYCDKNLI